MNDSNVRGAVREEAHAKINLTLEVLGKRGDGYHNLVSIIQTIDMHDVVTVENADRLSVTCDDPAVPDESNLAMRPRRRCADTLANAAAHASTFRRRSP